jgi:RNA polymerase sigma factor (sigma-70 family)
MGATVAFKPTRHLRVLPLGTLSDERLAELASVGHTDAFETLYERYRIVLARYCRSIVRDPEDAKDALQNTMVSVLRAVKVRVPAGPIRPWLYRIAHNEAISVIRRRHAHEELSPETPDRADVELASLTRDRLDALLVDLRSLPERQRGALVMRELGGLDYAEIGNALEMSAVSARKAVFEARVSLHDLTAGRNADCDEIRLRISHGDGRVLRGRNIRVHLSGCASCSAFEQGLHDRHGAFGLIPALPALSIAALLGIALPAGGGGSTSGLALGGSAASGSALGGGSIAAVKGIALGGAIAVAGAGVLVGSGIGTHVLHHHRVPRAAAHAQQFSRAGGYTASVAPVVRPAHVVLARTGAAPGRTVARVVRLTTPATSPTTVASKPNVRGPSVAVPVAKSTPAAGSPSPTAAPPSSTSTPITSAPTAPTTTTPATAAAAPPGPAQTNLAATIIETALHTAGADVAAAEAQAGQALSQAQAASGTATSMVQGLLNAILHGGQ